MKVSPLLDRFFSERSFSLAVKTAVFSGSVFLFLLFTIVYLNGLVAPAEARLVAFFFYVIVFFTTYICGFKPGIILTVLSSFLVIFIFAPGVTSFSRFTPAELELFPFLAIYFLIAITVDWFRNNYEDLKRQNARNQELYEQAKNLDKLALAGEIAAGITHEIRNPLTVVHGYVQLLSLKASADESRQEIYSLILDEINRTNEIISDFLRLSRPAKPDKTMVQLNEVAGGAASLIYGEALRSNVNINLQLDPDLPETALDREQMMQILLNLSANAIQAMPDGGTLSVATSYNKRNNQVEAAISDSGHGIPRELLEKIFSPFYTTRESGTGLGLAITHSIVLAHGGQITVESQPGAGSCFRLYFPVRQDCAGEEIEIWSSSPGL
jgi:signal transduction histidine kinase